MNKSNLTDRLSTHPQRTDTEYAQQEIYGEESLRGEAEKPWSGLGLYCDIPYSLEEIYKLINNRVILKIKTNNEDQRKGHALYKINIASN